MVDFVRLQEIVKDRLEQDRNIRLVTTEGDTLEDAVSKAAILLDIPLRRLDYEVTERGQPGFMGRGKKLWSIQAYERIFAKKEELDISRFTDDDSLDYSSKDNKDGDCFVHLSSEGVFLKVVPPVGRGSKVKDIEAFRLIQSRGIKDYEKENISAAVKDATGEYVKVADYEHRIVNDSTVSVEIAEAESKALMVVTPPGPGGGDISFETFISFLRNNRVIYGINEEYLREFADRPIYKEKILIAEGLKPKDGKNAYMRYNFETDQKKIKLREGSDGRIDFKDINIIKNVVEKQPLAVKMPPERGVNGRTVTGKFIPAKDGKDIPLPLGKNVHVGEDGVTIVADINGQVVLAGGKVNVEPVYTVAGDVNLKTGNIIFLGTVVIRGNVEDGFSVKAAGNIEVNGTVSKADLDAEGDIIVHQGIAGKGSALVKAGRSLWARFIENSNIEVGNMVVVSDGIINSNVDANKRIICQGKRASIVGGKLRACEEINAKSLGSPTSGTETICEVGIDPKSKSQLEVLNGKKEEMESELGEIQRDLQTLINIKKQRKSLPEDKEAKLGELMDRRQMLMSDLVKNNEEAEKIQSYLTSLTANGKISASGKVYPGVRIIIRDQMNDVRTEYKAVTFVLENGLIRVAPYEEPDEEAGKVPDGYSTS
ncbi:MAG: FapA family protein [Treponema sp.]|nr:FapA family protein [Treponema sp.]